jgi:hypothetical protein
LRPNPVYRKKTNNVTEGTTKHRGAMKMKENRIFEFRAGKGKASVHLSMPAPSGSGQIEVYGDGPTGWYEWRIVRPDGTITKDTGADGSGQLYDNPAIALRDALVYASADEPEPPVTPTP